MIKTHQRIILLRDEILHQVQSFTRELALKHPRYPLTEEALGLREAEYLFVYDYPLEQAAYFKHPMNAAVSIIDILLHGRQDYEAIYKAEEAVVGHPGYVPGLANRSVSAGPHGIWGHDLSDLWFEGVEINVDASIVQFVIGS